MQKPVWRQKCQVSFSWGRLRHVPGWTAKVREAQPFWRKLPPVCFIQCDWKNVCNEFDVKLKKRCVTKGNNMHTVPSGNPKLFYSSKTWQQFGRGKVNLSGVATLKVFGLLPQDLCWKHSSNFYRRPSLSPSSISMCILPSLLPNLPMFPHLSAVHSFKTTIIYYISSCTIM